ncbi:hypothetical protein F9U64_03785 [Gracilibacillus oryzae]|uniref:Flagellar protein n=1 Tax=Gracilibacillus oryzae TaxID=1672701 RepID=A0A7C8GV36_9BACI|nr:flagellar biosynthetic protein FliO [Gracilibacillus oryzae]KAB8138749.1 hypothetical protein F9U64_03785 [Gracilibacillus oryzae]
MKISRHVIGTIAVFLFFIIFCNQPLLASQSVEEYFNNGKNEEAEKTEETEAVEEEPVTESGEQAISSIQSPNLLGTLFQLIVALVVVVGLIYFIANFVKKRNRYLGRNQVVKSYGGITLGTNRSLQIVRIGERYFAVGLAENIELLLEITDNETIDQIKQSDEYQTQPIDFFKAKIKKRDNDDKTETKKEFGHLFNKELQEMKEGRKKMLQKMKEMEKDHDH